MIAQIALARPFDKLLDYQVPEAIQSTVFVGSRVMIPLGENEEIGYVVGLQSSSSLPDGKIRSIIKTYEHEPIFDSLMLSLCEWMREFYLCSLGEALHAAAPPPPTRCRARIREDTFAALDSPPPETLTLSQSKALAEIRARLGGGHQVCLLWGVTGSGKTEVYLKTIEAALALGMGTLCLVPEIALTPQILARFRSRFGERVALQHSRLSAGERYQAWLDIKSGSKPILLGTRSGVFAPMRNLGLIIIDEEHEPSYKQDETPRYHAKEVAIYRARQAGALVLLGSATPDLRTYHNSQRGKCQVFSMPERVDGRPLPEVKVVDMRAQEEKEGRHLILSNPLLAAMERRLFKGQQAILFLNRKGFATFVLCRKCGHVIQCEHCAVSLAYHADTGRMHCHHCNIQRAKPAFCPHCGSEKIGFLGGGTQKVEALVKEIFPEVVVDRLDADTTTRKGSHGRILDAFARGETQVLVGTQMVAKGLDFPNVTLVGIVYADTGLNWPHFRSSERTFQILTQVAGRAGRGAEPGEVFVQSYNPGHYAIQCAKRQDFLGFFGREINSRRALGYPPFRYLMTITFSAVNAQKTEEAARRLAGLLQIGEDPPEARFEILGPAPGVIERLRGEYIWELTVLSASHGWMREKVRRAVNEAGVAAGMRIMVDS